MKALIIGALALGALRDCYPASMPAEIVNIELVFIGLAVPSLVAVVRMLKLRTADGLCGR